MTFPIQVFDPPLCCSTGVCGPDVDPELVRFAADLEWLAAQGVEVERVNMSQEPGRFAEDPVVARELAARGNACLPLILAAGTVVDRGRYPTREELAAYAELDAQLAKATTDALVATKGCCGGKARAEAEEPKSTCCGGETKSEQASPKSCC
ncbi:MAG: arsenite efflux transporter metallochaperone ArsD [Deltaproteobacteria bacterium]|nr:arsenite efflux transporter metallochaperone ArsD [Deltaproteobacteria bacterium]